MEPDHPFVIARLAFVFLWALPAVRELFQYISDPRFVSLFTGVSSLRCSLSSRKAVRMGQHVWLLLATIATELLVIKKWSKGMFAPFPKTVKLGWAIGVALLVSYSVMQVRCWYRLFPLDWETYPVLTVWSAASAEVCPKPKTEIQNKSVIELTSNKLSKRWYSQRPLDLIFGNRLVIGFILWLLIVYISVNYCIQNFENHRCTSPVRLLSLKFPDANLTSVLEGASHFLRWSGISFILQISEVAGSTNPPGAERKRM